MHPTDEREFAEYFADRRDAVRRGAYLLCGDWHRADGVAQTAFVKLHRSWDSVRDKGALDAWMRRTVVRAVVDESRRPWRRERSTEVLPERPAVAPDDELGTRELVLAGLRAVPPRQRAVLVLRFIEDQDVAATAAALGFSEGNVKSQTSRGLDALRRALAGSGLGGLGGPGTGEQAEEVSGRG